MSRSLDALLAYIGELSARQAALPKDNGILKSPEEVALETAHEAYRRALAGAIADDADARRRSGLKVAR